MVKITNISTGDLEKVLSRQLKPYLQAVHHILKADGHNRTYCEELLSNIYHHARSAASEQMAQYSLEDAIHIALKKMVPAETYRLEYFEEEIH